MLCLGKKTSKKIILLPALRSIYFAIGMERDDCCLMILLLLLIYTFWHYASLKKIIIPALFSIYFEIGLVFHQGPFF